MIMKKLIKTSFFKTGFLMTVLSLIQAGAFASEKEPDVYLSRAPVSELSGPELLDTTWFWLLILVVAMVLISAAIAAKRRKGGHEPAAI